MRRAVRSGGCAQPPPRTGGPVETGTPGGESKRGPARILPCRYFDPQRTRVWA